MFKIPEWEETIPAPNLDFLKEIKKKQHKQNNKKLIPTTQNHSEFNNNNEKLVGKSTEIIHTKRKTILKKRDVVSNSVTKKKTSVTINNFSGIKKTHKSKHINNNFKTKEEFVNKEDDSRVDSKVVQQCNKRKHESCFNKNKDDLNENKDDLNKNKVDLNENKDDLNEKFEVENFDTDMLDEVIINAKKQKLKKFNHKEEKDVEEMFSRTISKDDRKKQLLKNILQKESHRNTYKVNGNGLRERMLQRLKAAQFRYLNEKLYTSSGSDAKKLFDEDPNAFHTYHQGYQQQVKKWPVKPLDVIVKRILKMPKSHLITDMGCGEGSLSRRVPQTVRSFDLVAFNDHVEVCDIAHTPLLASSMNAAVYCLALMGTDLTQYIVEANRVLKKGGHLLIAEVESRFDDVDKFITDVQRIGFTLKELDKSNDVFYFMEFTKVNEPPKKNKLPFLSLKPCFYKKR